MGFVIFHFCLRFWNQICTARAVMPGISIDSFALSFAFGFGFLSNSPVSTRVSSEVNLRRFLPAFWSCKSAAASASGDSIPPSICGDVGDTGDDADGTEDTGEVVEGVVFAGELLLPTPFGWLLFEFGLRTGRDVGTGGMNTFIALCGSGGMADVPRGGMVGYVTVA